MAAPAVLRESLIKRMDDAPVGERFSVPKAYTHQATSIRSCLKEHREIELALADPQRKIRGYVIKPEQLEEMKRDVGIDLYIRHKSEFDVARYLSAGERIYWKRISEDLEKSVGGTYSQARQRIEESSPPPRGNIIKVGDGFEVRLPGLINPENGYFLGSSDAKVDNPEDAVRRVEDVRIFSGEFPEFHYLIKQANVIAPNGVFEKLAREGATSVIVGRSGSTPITFTGSWVEVRRSLVEHLATNEKHSQTPFLRLEISDGTYLECMTIDQISRVSPKTVHPTELPAFAYEYISELEINEKFNRADELNYEMQWKRPDASSSIVSFLERYLEDEGRDLKESLGILDLRDLTPYQAVSLCLEVTQRLMVYDRVRNVEKDETSRAEFDKVALIDVLEDSFENRNKPGWTGSGVCRNFAACTKGIFDALKSEQGYLSALNDTYCLYRSGKEYTLRGPSERDGKVIGHAWNEFLVINGTTTQWFTADATWAPDHNGVNLAAFDQSFERSHHPILDIFRYNNKTELAASAYDALDGYMLALAHYLRAEEATYTNEQRESGWSQLISTATEFAREGKRNYTAQFGEMVIDAFATYPNIVRDRSVLRHLYNSHKDDPRMTRIIDAYISKASEGSHLLVSDAPLQEAIIRRAVALGKFHYDDPRLNKSVRELCPDLFVNSWR